MAIAYLITFYLGLASVLQGGLNRKIAASWGFPGATLLNSLIILSISTLIFCLVRQIEPPELFRDRGSFQGFAWWYFLPGVLGFTIVFSIPIVIQRLGALNVFVALIFSQLLASALWDYFAEGIPVAKTRILGALLAFAGAIIAAIR